MATKHQLFQFNGKLCEQDDGAAMGSPLGPLIHAFSGAEDKSNNLPSFYNRYVDDTLTKQSSLESAESFLKENILEDVISLLDPLTNQSLSNKPLFF